MFPRLFSRNFGVKKAKKKKKNNKYVYATPACAVLAKCSHFIFCRTSRYCLVFANRATISENVIEPTKYATHGLITTSPTNVPCTAFVRILAVLCEKSLIWQLVEVSIHAGTRHQPRTEYVDVNSTVFRKFERVSLNRVGRTIVILMAHSNRLFFRPNKYVSQLKRS